MFLLFTNNAFEKSSMMFQTLFHSSWRRTNYSLLDVLRDHISSNVNATLVEIKTFIFHLKIMSSRNFLPFHVTCPFTRPNQTFSKGNFMRSKVNETRPASIAFKLLMRSHRTSYNEKSILF